MIILRCTGPIANDVVIGASEAYWRGRNVRSVPLLHFCKVTDEVEVVLIK